MIAHPSGAVYIGLGQYETSSRPIKLVCSGVSSCIALLMADRTAGVAGMAHVLLPASLTAHPDDSPAKFADTAVPKLLHEVEALGAEQSRLLIAMVGGAHLFQMGPDATSVFDMGSRNTKAVLDALSGYFLRPHVAELGGSAGRTVTYDMHSGHLLVKSAVGAERMIYSPETRGRVA